MNLRLILGRAGCGKTHVCLNEVAAELSKKSEERQLILVVPEQATFELEKLLASACPAAGFMRAHVVGFRRLAHRILNQTGGAARPHITEIGKRLAINRLLMENKDSLKILSHLPPEASAPTALNLPALPSMANTLAGMIKDFKNYGLNWEQLTNIAQIPLDNTSKNTISLSKKLDDLALIYKKFDEFLDGRYSDPEDYLKLLTEKIPEAEFIKQSSIWIDGFSWFTPQEHDVLEALILAAQSVNITLCLDILNTSSQESPDSLFNRQWNTRRRLLELSDKLKCPVSEEHLTIGHRFSGQPLLVHIERSFSYSNYSQKQLNHENLIVGDKTEQLPGLTIAEAANRKVEAEIISREIIRLSRENNFRWKDMAILLRDQEPYRDLLETVLTDYDIPFFSDADRLALHHPLAEFIRSVIDIILEKWNYEPIFRALKTDFFDLNRDEVDILENYSLEFGLRGKHWLSSHPWTFYRNYSLNDDNSTKNSEQNKAKNETIEQRKNDFLAKINDIRFRATSELLSFSVKLNSRLPMEIEKLVQALYELIIRLNIPDTLIKWADAAEEKGELAEAREDRQIWQVILELLDQMVETFKGQKLSLTDFAVLINEGLNELSFNLIPPGLDYVAITDVKRTKISNIKAAFVPGVNDGAFPFRHTESGLITESDRAVLLSLGVELPGGISDEIFFEQFLVYTALTRASQYLWISYPLADTEGETLPPSIIVKRLKEIPGAKIVSYPAQPPLGQEKDYISTPKKTLPFLANSFRTYKETGVLGNPWRQVYNWALDDSRFKTLLTNFLAGLFHVNQVDRLNQRLAKLIFCDKKGSQNLLRGSVTRFESFRACPFQHFAKYGLKLKERPVYKLKTPDLGLFLHAIMKKFGDTAALNKRDWADLTYEEIKAWCAVIVADLAPKLQNEILVSSPQYEHLLGRLEKKAVKSIVRLADFSGKSHFKPAALEQSFGLGSLPPLTFSLDGKERVEIVGQIDRVDTLNHNEKNYLLIIDYKSGGAGISLNEVFYGLKLQLVTYLLAMLNSGDFFPGGMVYYYLKNPIITEKNFITSEQVNANINKILKMSGWLLADMEILGLLDGSLPGNSDFFKVSSKIGGFSKNSLASLKSPEEFSLILSYLRQELKSISQNILTGKASIFPCRLGQFNPCAYCSYLEVCQFDRWLLENKFNILPKLTDEDIFAKMVLKNLGEENFL